MTHDAVQRWIDDPTFWESHVHPDDRDWAKNYCITSTSRGEDPLGAADQRKVMDGRRFW